MMWFKSDFGTKDECKSCGTIYNFSIDIDSLTSEDLINFKINDKNVYFKGICPGCLSSINKTSEGGLNYGRNEMSSNR